MCPPSDDTGDGFFARWSRRKALVRQGERPVEPTAPPQPRGTDGGVAGAATPSPQPLSHEGRGASSGAQAFAHTPPAFPPSPLVGKGRGEGQRAAPPPPPTLDDLARLNPQDASADFSRFVQPEVDPALKNAALKKLFTDPHFNVMDGLDVYIDDYSQPDPLPPGMLEQLQLGEYLGLREPTPPAQPLAATAANSPAATAPEPPTPARADTHAEAEAEADAHTDAAAPASTEPAPSPDIPDENADLRLQPHDAAGRPSPEPCAGPDAGRLG